MPKERAHWAMSSNGATPITLGHPTGLMLPKSLEIVCEKPCGFFFLQLVMTKAVVFRGKILFQTMGIRIVTFLENGVIPAFL